jgi:hypothetical protein
MNQKESGWRYYLPEQGEDASDARNIMIGSWQGCYDEEMAASYASENEWDHGEDRSFGVGPVVAVLDKDGNETRFATERKMSIDHSVSELA